LLEKEFGGKFDFLVIGAGVVLGLPKAALVPSDDAVLVAHLARRDRRGRTTRSLPPMMWPGVAVSRFDTIKKRERSLPWASVNAKYFWFVCMVKIRHSCGTVKNCASKWHS